MSHLDDILDLSRQSRIGTLSPWLSIQLDALVADGTFPEADRIASVGQSLINDLQGLRESGRVPGVAVIGMSGGVDSALTADLLKSAGFEVHGYTLPIHQVSDETARGMAACEALDLRATHIDLTAEYEAILGGLSRTSPELARARDRDLDIRRGNLRARLRMMVLYDQAKRHGGIVASTDNFSELTAGFWTLHGDVGDLAPIQSLLKSWEVPALARYREIPEETWRATPTDGLGISNGDEEQLGASYLEWDIMVLSVFRALKGAPDLERADVLRVLDLDHDPHAKDVAKSVFERMSRSHFKRSGTLNLPHPLADRYDMIAGIDKCLGCAS